MILNRPLRVRVSLPALGEKYVDGYYYKRYIRMLFFGSMFRFLYLLNKLKRKIKIGYYNDFLTEELLIIDIILGLVGIIISSIFWFLTIPVCELGKLIKYVITKWVDSIQCSS